MKMENRELKFPTFNLDNCSDVAMKQRMPAVPETKEVKNRFLLVSCGQYVPANTLNLATWH